MSIRSVGSKTKKFLPYSFRLAAGGLGGAALKMKGIFWVLHRATIGSASEARGENHHALRAYDWVQSHNALGAWKDQSLRDWKKVRAKVNISAPNDTSARESEGERHAAGAAGGKNSRREATKWLGGGTEKWTDLFLVSYPKIIFPKL